MAKIMMIDAKWEPALRLGRDIFAYLERERPAAVALFAPVQFTELDRIKEQLQGIGISVLTTEAKRAHVRSQILGCDAYLDAYGDETIFKADLLLYVGDGRFHPKALLLAQIYTSEIKPVVIWNPVLEKMEIITVDDIKKQLKRMRANLKRFMASDTIGILVSVKPGQQYLVKAAKLRAFLEKQGKQAYLFIDDTLSLQSLEHYPFIQAWVNSACPRIGTDDSTTIQKPLINMREAFDPVKALEKLYGG